jgi:hypothetical protein
LEVEECIGGGGMHWRQRNTLEAEEYIRGRRDASEVEGCIGGSGMHQRSMEADGAARVESSSH